MVEQGERRRKSGCGMVALSSPLVALLLCGATLASGCSSQTAPVPPPVCDAPQGTSAEALQLVSADTAFALAFYPPAVAASGAGSNVVLSPYSVSATLTMLDTGAAGEFDAGCPVFLRDLYEQ